MRRFFLYSAAFLFSITTYAQFDRGGKKISDGLAWGQWDGLAILQTKQFKEDRDNTKNSHTFVQGSPYYTKTFKKAVVSYYEEVIPQDIYLRYNANTDELEMSSYQHTGETDQMLLPDKDLKAKIGSETYNYRSYYDNFKKKEVLKGYFILLLEGSPYNLYLKKTKEFREAKIAKTSLERSFPARFEEKIQYYFQTGNETLIPVKASKSSLYKVLDKKIVNSIFKKLTQSSGDEKQFLIHFFTELNSLK